MSTVNIESRPPQSFVYPHFHDASSTRKTNKDVEIDKSVYHLLSLYLNAESLEKINPNSLLATKIPKRPALYPYSRTRSSFSYRTQRNWLGEENHHAYKHTSQDTLVDRNTVENSKTIHYKDSNMAKKNKRPKSVSFNETVTVIISQDNKLSSQLKQQPDRNETEDDDDLIFVDALEFI